MAAIMWASTVAEAIVNGKDAAKVADLDKFVNNYDLQGDDGRCTSECSCGLTVYRNIQERFKVFPECRVHGANAAKRQGCCMKALGDVSEQDVLDGEGRLCFCNEIVGELLKACGKLEGNKIMYRLDLWRKGILSIDGHLMISYSYYSYIKCTGDLACVLEALVAIAHAEAGIFTDCQVQRFYLSSKKYVVL